MCGTHGKHQMGCAEVLAEILQGVVHQNHATRHTGNVYTPASGSKAPDMWYVRGPNHIWDIHGVGTMVWVAQKNLEEYKDSFTSLPSFKDKLGSLSWLKSVLQAASGLLALPDQFFEQGAEKFPHLIPVQNGVVNARTCKLEPFDHHQDARFTFQLPVEWDPNADSEPVREFVAAVFNNDAGTIESFHIAQGVQHPNYCLIVTYMSCYPLSTILSDFCHW